MSVVANVAINVDSSNAVSKLKQVQQGAQATSQAVDKLNATNDALAASFAKSGKPIQTAANGMRFFTDATGRARKENGQFVTTAEAAAAGLRKQGIAAQQTAGKLNGLRSAVLGLGSAFGGIAAVLGVIQAGRFVFAKTAEVESQTRSLQVLTGSAEKAGQIIKELQDLGAVTPFTSTELIDAAKRLQAFGVEADKVVETTRRLADASGATGAELSGLVTAYGQVQAKGRLQGEELLQFQERGIALQEELRKMYGMTGEEFQKTLEKGQISAKAVEVALVNLTNTGGKYANGAIAQSDTLSGRLSTLQDNVDGVAREVGKVLTPALIGILQQLNTSLSQTPAFVEDIALAFQYAAGQIAPFLNGLSQMQWFFTNLTPPGWAMQVIGGAAERGKSTTRGAASRQRQSRKNSFIGPAAPQMQGPAIPERLRQKPNNLPPPLMIPGATVGGGGGGRTAGGGADKAANDAKRAAEQAAQAEQQIQDRLRGLIREVELIDQIAGIKELQFQAEMEGNKELQIRLQGEERIIQIMQSTAQALDGITDERLKQNILAKAESEIASSRQETAFEMQRIDTERTKSFNEIITGLDLELALKTATTEQAREQLRLEAEIAKLRGQGFTPEQIGAITAKKTELAAPKTDQQNITEKIATLKKEITDLTSISNIAITSAEGIGNAFAQSFQGLISGSMTAKEALGSFFKSVGDMFLEMAAQIIAKQMTMIILQTILKALGAVGGGGGGANLTNTQATDFGFNPSAMTGSLTPGGLFAKGGAFTNSVVSSPTMFKFADGGAMRTGLMGEAGPEAIMPLKRGADGSLGVQANGLREAMNQDRTGGTSGSPVLNMSFQSTSINGVEYVSRDQLEAAMAETRRASTRDGAKRGMTMTLDRIQNSSSTRRRAGI